MITTHSFVFVCSGWEISEYGGQQAMRFGNWKGVRKEIQIGNIKIKLYNLDMDIQEQNDVAGEHPDITKKVEDIME